VQVLGNNQHFSNRTAREVLGWEPRVGYEAGLAATIAWLKTEYLNQPPRRRGVSRDPGAARSHTRLERRMSAGASHSSDGQ
jgi:hypothetical protein